MSVNQPSEHSQSAKAYKLWVILIFLGMIALFGILGARLLIDGDEPVVIGSKAPDFVLTDFSGPTIDTSKLRGKTVLINFWASWCAPCEDEAEMLEETWRTYRDDGTEAVLFIGVAYMEIETASQAFLSEFDVTYPNGPDLQGKISDLYKVTSVPETYLVDPEGILRNVKKGPFSSVEEILTFIEMTQIGN